MQDDTAPRESKVQFDEVYAYAKKSAEYFIVKHAVDFPFDQKEEILQNAMLRVWKAFQELQPDMGWKSYIQQHCRGAVLDFINGGSFEDGHRSVSQPDYLSERIEIASGSDEGSIISVEETAALFGVYTESGTAQKLFAPRWELVRRLCGVDEDLHIVAKVLYGWTQEDIAAQFSLAFRKGSGGISRERIGQRIRLFFARLDEPESYYSDAIKQTIYALGLSEMYSQPDVDNGYGWDFPPIAIEREDSFRIAQRAYVPSLFDLEEGPFLPDNVAV